MTKTSCKYLQIFTNIKNTTLSRFNSLERKVELLSLKMYNNKYPDRRDNGKEGGGKTLDQ